MAYRVYKVHVARLGAGVQQRIEGRHRRVLPRLQGAKCPVSFAHKRWALLHSAVRRLTSETATDAERSVVTAAMQLAVRTSMQWDVRTLTVRCSFSLSARTASMICRGTDMLVRPKGLTTLPHCIASSGPAGTQANGHPRHGARRSTSAAGPMKPCSTLQQYIIAPLCSRKWLLCRCAIRGLQSLHAERTCCLEPLHCHVPAARRSRTAATPPSGSAGVCECRRRPLLPRYCPCYHR